MHTNAKMIICAGLLLLIIAIAAGATVISSSHYCSTYGGSPTGTGTDKCSAQAASATQSSNPQMASYAYCTQDPNYLIGAWSTVQIGSTATGSHACAVGHSATMLGNYYSTAVESTTGAFISAAYNGWPSGTEVYHDYRVTNCNGIEVETDQWSMDPGNCLYPDWAPN